MYWPLSHMVQPKEKALQCSDCHGERGVLDWSALGLRGRSGLPRRSPSHGADARPSKEEADDDSWPRLVASCLLLVAFAAAGQRAELQPLHPPVPLLDRGRAQSVSSRASPSRRCGAAAAATTPGTSPRTATTCRWGGTSGRRSGQHPAAGPGTGAPGSFGRWNPLTYRYLSPPGDKQLDLGIAEWMQRFGGRHVGGGPAGFGPRRHGRLVARAAAAGAGASIRTRRSWIRARRRAGWDGRQSGVAEMNCFLCHIAQPDNDARVAGTGRAAVSSGQTRRHCRTPGVVQPRRRGLALLPDAFRPMTARVEAGQTGHSGTEESATAACVTAGEHGDAAVPLGRCRWRRGPRPPRGRCSRRNGSGVGGQPAGQEQLVPALGRSRRAACWSAPVATSRSTIRRRTNRRRGAVREHLRFEPRRLAMASTCGGPATSSPRGTRRRARWPRHLDGTMRRCERLPQCGADPRLAALSRRALRPFELRSVPHSADLRPGRCGRWTGRC